MEKTFVWTQDHCYKLFCLYHISGCKGGAKNNHPAITTVTLLVIVVVTSKIETDLTGPAFRIQESVFLFYFIFFKKSRKNSALILRVCG